MATITIPGSTNDVSDGYHTFGELYEHRIMLFIVILKMAPPSWEAWRSRYHHDGEAPFGDLNWFIAGAHIPGKGQITYHLPITVWSLCEGIEIRERAPEWDGHSSNDVLYRLRDWLAYPEKEDR